jgi:hypothetical protein
MTVEHRRPPRWAAIAREQFRAIGLSMRQDAIIFAIALAALSLLFVIAALKEQTAIGRPAGNQAALMYPLLMAAAFVPLGVWRDEDRARRSWHWSLPVEPRAHSLIKVGAGALWVAGTAVIYSSYIQVLELALSRIGARASARIFAAGFYGQAIAGSVLLYAMISVFLVGSRQPWRWIAVLACAWVFGAVAAASARLPLIRDGFVAIWDGSLGLSLALSGVSHRHALGSEAATSAIPAIALWTTVAAAGIWVASSRHPER